MTKQNSGKTTLLRRQKLAVLLHSSDPNLLFPTHHLPENNDDYSDHRRSNASSLSPNMSSASSPVHFMSPINQTPSPYTKSPWILPHFDNAGAGDLHNTGLIGSLVREGGHIYSLACSGDLLYTGSDSKNIRVWKDLVEFSGFKSSSGLVKAIVVSGDRIFTGHQDGELTKLREKIQPEKTTTKKSNLVLKSRANQQPEEESATACSKSGSTLPPPENSHVSEETIFWIMDRFAPC
ncbi:hypothetical protein SSX86_024067 [Deinandra increscens subsp. villosa]|uniref:Uncharacterized protein n=1 Tax=Deinandra increscens subsp. villosa TaxID=3103831 RepID=A0AAP0CMF1_9ASTR